MAEGALSPLDGRYAGQVETYARAFSEEALVRRRFQVEVAWFLALAGDPSLAGEMVLGPGGADLVEGWVAGFGPSDVERVRQIERTINHDVKAVEYLLKEKLGAAGMAGSAELVHLGCTSEDINNIAYSLMLREGLEEAWLPAARSLAADAWSLAEAHRHLPMLGHTHGQPASPTTMGKELAVFAARWDRLLSTIESIPLLAKFNGAVGTFGAHTVAYPEVDWIDLSRRFVEGFGLRWNPLTTQIEPHDSLGEVFHAVVRFNAVLVDFCRDAWEYTSRGYFRQRALEAEVGSSTMPHKVNPIDFENAEANAGVSSALLEHLSSKLMASRMQRDLSDSSALRNMGVGLGHSGLAVGAARRGLSKVTPDGARMAADLDGHWEVLAEAIQTVMRRFGLAAPYERLKVLTRGGTVSPAELQRFVKELGLPPEAEERLLALTPAGYTGLASDLVSVGRSRAGR